MIVNNKEVHVYLCNVFSFRMDDSCSVDLKSDTVVLSEEDLQKLRIQETRLVSNFKAEQLEKDSKKHWDIFYKRNEDRFFKDRHWTTREFEELIENSGSSKVLFEVGCGAGNFIYPLLSEDPSLFVYACDFSPRAIDLVKSHELYDENRLKAFVCDVTIVGAFDEIPKSSVDIVTLIFVLSAIHPKHYHVVLQSLYSVLKPGACILFRDYGLYDMAQLRFKPGHKISENFYMRQDGTRSLLLVYSLYKPCLFSLSQIVFCFILLITKDGNDRKVVTLMKKS